MLFEITKQRSSLPRESQGPDSQSCLHTETVSAAGMAVASWLERMDTNMTGCGRTTRSMEPVSAKLIADRLQQESQAHCWQITTGQQHCC